jgi:hypothetical protein
VLVATVLTPVAVASAVGASPVVRTFVTADTDANQIPGLQYRDDTGAAGTVSEQADRFVNRVASSSDGTRIAYADDVYAASGLVARRLVVRDVSGRLVRVVTTTDAVAAANIVIEDVALAPDGGVVAWTQRNYNNQAATVYAADTSSGAVTTVAAGHRLVGFLDQTHVIVDTSPGAVSGIQDVYLTTGVATGFHVTLGPDAFWATPSPDGTQLAWSAWVCVFPAMCAQLTYDLMTATVTGSAVGTPTVLVAGSPSAENISATFSADSSTVFFVQRGLGGGGADVWSVPVTGGTATRSAATVEEEQSVALGLVDRNPPGPVLSAAATLSGTSATLTWAAPVADDLSGIEVTRTSGADPGRAVVLPAGTTTWTDTGLSLGSTYSYFVRPLDRSGNRGTEVEMRLTALAAAPSFSDPTSLTTAAAPFVVRLTAAGWTVPAGVTFDADFSVNNGPWKPWLRAVSGATRTFGVAGTLPATTPLASTGPGVVTTSSVAGGTYRFRVSVSDAFGHTTPQVLSAKAVVPFDQTRATFSSGTVTASSSAWLGSYRTLAALNATARITVSTDRFQLVGGRCTLCGVFDVFDGAVRIGTVDTRATTTISRAVLFTKTWTAKGTHAITIKARGTLGRPSVRLDGFGVRF